MSSWDPCRTGDMVEDLLSQGAGPAIIVAPFAKHAAVSRLCEMVDGQVDLYTRWLPHEVAAGVTDLSVLDAVKSTGGSVRLHPRVHAKLYLRGDEALVGSANASPTGLGYRSPAAVELLVPVSLPSEPVTRLLQLLDATSATADQALRDAVESAASRIDPQALPPDSQPAHEDATGNARATHLIEFRDPKSIWQYYSKPATYDSDLGSQALATVASLGVPLGIRDRETFNAFVGAAMRQGVHGRVLRECRGLPPHAAVERYRTILSAAGTAVPAETADRNWRAFCNWADEFVPEIALRSSTVGF